MKGPKCSHVSHNVRTSISKLVCIPVRIVCCTHYYNIYIYIYITNRNNCKLNMISKLFIVATKTLNPIGINQDTIM